MVRAHIAHIGQVVSKGFDDLLINAVGVEPCIVISATQRYTKTTWRVDRATDSSAHHPERWPPRIRVGLAIVPNKGLMAAVQFAVETCEALLMQVGASKQDRVLIGVGPVLSAQYVRPARAKRRLLLARWHPSPAVEVSNQSCTGPKYCQNQRRVGRRDHPMLWWVFPRTANMLSSR